MSDLLAWVFACYGLTIILTMSVIMAPLRDFFQWKEVKSTLITKAMRWVGTLIQCPMCTSFWVGLFANRFWFSATNNLLMDAFLASGSCWVIYSALQSGYSNQHH